MGVSLPNLLIVGFEPVGGFVILRFLPRMVMEMAVITSGMRPLPVVGQAFLELLKQELATLRNRSPQSVTRTCRRRATECWQTVTGREGQKERNGKTV